MRKGLVGIFSFGCLLAQPALAHPGHENLGFAAGLVHPLTGLDHMLVMVAVGLWAGLVLGDKKWIWPAAFVSFMLAGFAFGAAGGAFPAAETIIAASLVGIGLCLAFNVRAPAGIGAALIAFCAVAHGFAHGAEMPQSSNPWAFAAGFAAATIALHIAGLALAAVIMRSPKNPAARIAGGGLAVAGMLIALAG